MKAIIVTLIAAVLAVCATVWSPAVTVDNTPTIEPPPAVATEPASVEPQAEEPNARQKLPKLAPAPDPEQEPEQQAGPIPMPVPQGEIVAKIEEPRPTTEAAQPIIEEPPTPAETVEEPAITEPAKVDTEIIIEHAKTGYEEEPPTEPPIVEPEPPAQAANIGTAIVAAEAFAINVYNVVIDSSLDFDNSAYRFPAVVPLTVDQDTLNTKAIDIANYTFEQMMRRNDATIEKMREAGIRCCIYAEQTDHDILIYCLYC